MGKVSVGARDVGAFIVRNAYDLMYRPTRRCRRARMMAEEPGKTAPTPAAGGISIENPTREDMIQMLMSTSGMTREHALDWWGNHLPG